MSHDDDTHEQTGLAGLIDSDDQPGIDPSAETTGIKRILRIGVGVILVIAGIAMLVLPGQGVLTILVGLNLIKPDNAISRWIRRKTPGLEEDGPIPMTVIYAGIALFVVMGVLSFFFAADVTNWITGLF